MKRFTLITLLVCVSIMFAFAGDKNFTMKDKNVTLELNMLKSPGQFDGNEYLKCMREKSAWLKSEAAELNVRSIQSVVVTKEEMEEVDTAQCESCNKAVAKETKLRVGVSKSFDAVTIGSHGSVKKTVDGGFVWTMLFESRDATAIRLHLTDFNVPEGARVYVYTDRGDAFGPYTELGPNKNGDFWTNATGGQLAYLQVHADPGVNKDAIAFKVTEIGHIGPKFLIPFYRNPFEYEDLSVAQQHCSYNEPCVEDAACYGTGQFPGYNDAKYGVAHILYVSGAYWYMCSGGLLNNTAQDFTPYFLTANHCVSKPNEANTLETYFQYYNSSCNGSCVSRGTADTTGASLLSKSSKNSDYSFLQLNQAPPAGSVFMGWNATAVANNHGFNLYRISHPSGAPQGYSEHDVDTNKVTCRSWPRGKWIYSKDTVGATEGGSSGSPVCNSSGQVVGQLSGACGYNPSDPCDSQNNATVDGAFANYYSSIAQWLNPN